jgi:D-3-phosphoglycerate dehydrogenase
MKRILVTPRSLTREPRPELEPLERAGYELVFSTPGALPDEEELVRLVPGCVGYLAGIERIGEPVFRAADSLVAISRNGAGVDNIDVNAAAARSVEVLRTQGANARGVAELTLALLLGALRHVPRDDATVKQGAVERLEGLEACGRTLGLVGCGAIGRIVAGLAVALGMRVLAYDVAPSEDLPTTGGLRLASFDEVVSTCDVLTLHCPPLPDDRPLIGAAELARLRQGAVLINTARRSLVDRSAALAALEDGSLRAYAGDTVDSRADIDALARHPRAIETPHIGGYTAESVARATESAVANLLSALQQAPS